MGQTAVLLSGFLCLSTTMAVAQEATITDVGWDTCARAPTRACVLSEALIHARSVDAADVREGQFERIVDLHAAAGNIRAAMEIAQGIPPGRVSRVKALLSIGSAQSRLDMASESKETFTNARQLADSLADQMTRAEALQLLAKAAGGLGMAAEASGALEDSLSRRKLGSKTRP
jgi:hypothetical protein